jgi:hypothetical protein
MAVMIAPQPFARRVERQVTRCEAWHISTAFDLFTSFYVTCITGVQVARVIPTLKARDGGMLRVI